MVESLNRRAALTLNKFLSVQASNIEVEKLRESGKLCSLVGKFVNRKAHCSRKTQEGPQIVLELPSESLDWDLRE